MMSANDIIAFDLDSHPLVRRWEQTLAILEPRLAAIQESSVPTSTWTTYVKEHRSAAMRSLAVNVFVGGREDLSPSDESMFVIPVDFPRIAAANYAPVGREIATAVVHGNKPPILFSAQDFVATKYFFLFSYLKPACQDMDIAVRYLGIVALRVGGFPEVVQRIISLSGLSPNYEINIPAPDSFLIPSGALRQIAKSVADTARGLRLLATLVTQNHSVPSVVAPPQEAPLVITPDGSQLSAMAPTILNVLPSLHHHTVIGQQVQVQFPVSDEHLDLFEKVVDRLLYLYPPAATAAGAASRGEVCDLARCMFFPSLPAGMPINPFALNFRHAVLMARKFFCSEPAPSDDVIPSEAVVEKMIYLQFGPSYEEGFRAASSDMTARALAAATPTASTLSIASFAPPRDNYGPIVDMAKFERCWQCMTQFYQAFYGSPMAAALSKLRCSLLGFAAHAGADVMTPPMMVRLGQEVLVSLPRQLYRRVWVDRAAGGRFKSALELTTFLEAACTLGIDSKLYKNFEHELHMDMIRTVSVLHQEMVARQRQSSAGRIDRRQHASRQRPRHFRHSGHSRHGRRKRGNKRSAHSAGLVPVSDGSTDNSQRRPRFAGR